MMIAAISCAQADKGGAKLFTGAFSVVLFILPIRDPKLSAVEWV